MLFKIFTPLAKSSTKKPPFIDPVATLMIFTIKVVFKSVKDTALVTYNIAASNGTMGMLTEGNIIDKTAIIIMYGIIVRSNYVAIASYQYWLL